MAAHRLELAEARRIAIRAQLLDATRPDDLLEVVERLTLLQLDPTAAVAPSADLVLWSRLGPAYRPSELQQALEIDRTLFEFNGVVRPMRDLGLYLADMAAWPKWPKQRAWLAANDRFRRDILDQLGASGPLLSREIPDTSEVPWPSSGWTNDRNVTQMLEFLMMRGEVAISGRIGRQRTWDLAENVYPRDTPVIPSDEATRIKAERRIRALGIARGKGTAVPVDSNIVGEAGEPATIEGVRGSWRVDPEQLGQPFEGRTALLSPFDRLTYDRNRALALFRFEYILEMFKPVARRRWGYYALPILHGDRLVGKLDATGDRQGSTLRVRAIHQDVPFTREITAGVDAEIDSLASWLDLDAIDRPA